MTAPSLPCPDSTQDADAGVAARRLLAWHVGFDDIPREAWDRLYAITARATPFSSWTFHRAWWDAYRATAHDEYLVCVAPGNGSAIAAGNSAGSPAAGRPDPALAAAGKTTGPAIAADEIRAIVPLMHRHEIEPEDTLTRTVLRLPPSLPTTRVSGVAKAVFFGASYHADYATILCDPSDLADVADATVGSLAAGSDPAHGTRDWDVVDLRRLRHDDPTLDALESAFRAAAPEEGWTVVSEREDVAPVLTVSTGDWDAYLETLEGKERHEIRRKIRRAEAAGPLRFEPVPDPRAFVDSFVAIHQARWGDEGLFPDTEGGRRSRHFLERLAELEGPDGRLRFGRLTMNCRMIFASAAFHDDDAVYYYNAGQDPAARDLSPGVVGVAAYIRERLAAGTRVFDFLRGNEKYKYAWGAVDRPIYRLLVARRGE